MPGAPHYLMGNPYMRSMIPLAPAISPVRSVSPLGRMIRPDVNNSPLVRGGIPMNGLTTSINDPNKPGVFL